MLTDISVRRPWIGVSLFVLGILLSVVSCGLLVLHTRSFSLKRDTAVMIGTTLPELKSSVELLSANAQAEQLFAQDALVAREEQASAYVLPNGPVSTRAVQVLSEIASALTKNAGGNVTVQSLSFDAAATNLGSMKTVGAHLALKGDFHSVARFFAVLSFSGDMMVRDILSDQTTDQFLKLVVSSSPLSLKAAEDFLYLDLLQYAASPDKIEEAMTKDMQKDVAADVRTFLLQSGLAQVRSAFDKIATDLKEKNVWPMGLVTITSLKRNGDVWDADLVFYRR